MDKRIGFITHQGKRILLVDLSNCAAAEVEKIIRAVPDHVTAQQRASVLLLADFTGASFSEEVHRVMKEAAVFDKPYIKKSAWIGAENLPEAFYNSLRSFSGREFLIFKGRQEALTWLAGD